jgi:hypothetical protein
VKNTKKLTIIVPAILILFVLLILQVSCCFRVGSDFTGGTGKNGSGDTKGSSPGTTEPATEDTVPESSTKLEVPELAVVSKLKIPGQAIDVKASGGFAYLTNDLGVLFIINIKDKENPKITGKCAGINSANIIMIAGNYAFVSYTEWVFPEKSTTSDTEKQSDDGNPVSSSGVYSICGFKIIDITDKKNPVIAGDYVSGYKSEKSVQGLIIEGNYAYLNSTFYGDNYSESKLEIIDITDKKNPELAGSCDIEGQPNGLYVRGDFAYINNTYFDYRTREYTNKSKFFVIDIKNKTSPAVLGSCDVYANSWSVLVDGDYAYLSSSIYDEEIEDYKESKLQVISIKEPQNPLPIGGTDISGGAWELDYKDGFLFVSNNEGGINVINVKDPKNPATVTFLSTAGNSYDVNISGDYGYIADGFEGLVIISLQRKIQGEGITVQDGKNGQPANKKPVADIEIFGDKLNGNSFSEDNTIFFSAINSYDPEGNDLNYTWKINNRQILDDDSSPTGNYDPKANLSEKEDKLAYVFDEPGVYDIVLGVSDGTGTGTKSVKITVEEPQNPLKFLKEHNFKVEIECDLQNNSDITLYDLECYIRSPQTFWPFQTINSISTNLGKTDEVFDGSNNMLTHFEFDKNAKVEKNDIFKAKITLDVTMYEFSFKDIDTGQLDYKPGDEDLEKYTGEDIFMDTDSQILIDAVKKTVDNETDPVIMSHKLYDFVAKNIYYDFPRAADRHYEFMSASEILKKGKGVCADYAILYVTLLRIAGIPARVIGGIPVTLILPEKNRELDVGHAWVEIKLPGYGWIPIDITQEKGFMKPDFYMNLATEKGTSFLYESQTMDWNSYYYDGFKYRWDGQETPEVDQKLIYRIKNLDTKDIYVYSN